MESLLAQPASWHNAPEMRLSQPDEQQAEQPRSTAAAPRALEIPEDSQELREWYFALYKRGEKMCLEKNVMKQNYGVRTPVISVARGNHRREKQILQVQKAGLARGVCIARSVKM